MDRKKGGRPATGWRLRRKKGARFWCVRFTDPRTGRQRELSTGEEDKATAATTAARIYAAVLAGTYEPDRRSKPEALPERPLKPLVKEWLARVSGTLIAESTARTYLLYFRTHLEPFFKTLESVTADRCADYVVHRLRSVQPPTIRHELGALNALCEYAKWPIVMPRIPKRALGTPHKQGRRTPTEFSPAEAFAVFRRLPARDRYGQLCRLRYVLAYETGLRPKTLDVLSVPENYRRGADYLVLDRKDDKARDGRRVPLSRRARLILFWLTREGHTGAILGPRADHRVTLKRVAVEVLGPRGATFHPYDLRRMRITHLLEDTGNIPGVQHIVGHRRMSTTAFYVKPNERAARATLRLDERGRPR